jgi:hypothetical protein
MITSLLNLLIAIPGVLVVLSILCFRRRTLRYKFRFSFLAWLLLNYSTLQTGYVLLHGIHDPYLIAMMLPVTWAYCLILLRHRGNVAYLIPERICRN